MQKFLWILLISIIVSCNKKNNFQKDIFLGFKLGASKRSVDERIKELVRNGQMKLNEDYKPYYIHRTYNNRNYYSTPIVSTMPGDSLISEFRLLYFDDPKYLASDLENTLNNLRVLNLKTFTSDRDRIASTVIKKDIIDELSLKYGNYNKTDTFNFGTNSAELIQWLDKDGIDIKLTYFVNKNTSPYSITQGNSGVDLRYSFTDEFKEKFLKHKGVY